MRRFMNCVWNGLLIALGAATVAFLWILIGGALALVLLHGLTGGAAIAAVLGVALGAAAIMFLGVLVSRVLVCLTTTRRVQARTTATMAQAQHAESDQTWFEKFIQGNAFQIAFPAGLLAIYFLLMPVGK